MSVPLNADGTIKPLEIRLTKIRKWKRRETRRFIRLFFEGGVTSAILEEQDRFLSEYSNWTFDEISEIDNDEFADIFKQIREIIQDAGVPKVSDASS